MFKPGADAVDLGILPGGDESVAFGINNRGWIVGEAEVPRSADRLEPVYGKQPLQHAMFTDGVSMRDLNDLIPKLPQWELQSAEAINDRGEIVGFGWVQYDKRLPSVSHAFLLRPKWK